MGAARCSAVRSGPWESIPSTLEFDASAAAGSGICEVDGRMIDEPLARQARAVLDRARD